MKYYIVDPVNEQTDATDYRILTVKQEDEAAFLQEYADKIIASGNTLMEALLNFEQVKQERL